VLQDALALARGVRRWVSRAHLRSLAEADIPGGAAMSVPEPIASAFREVAYPGDDHIALHECPECCQIRDDLRGKSQVLQDGVLERRCDSLPLLSPAAFRYFVPAYMLYSLSHPDSEVAFFTCQGLGVAGFDAFYLERFRLFNLPQREAAIAFLEFFRSHEREDEDPDIRERQERQNQIDVAINRWKELP
jgi:hypothetical protein